MLNTALNASASIGGIELIDSIPSTTPKFEIVKLILQLVVGLIGVIKILKQPKKTD